jgi:hypothetical protein
MQASPIKMVEALWGGELPSFGTIDAANELISAVVTGLWEPAHAPPGTFGAVSTDPLAANRRGREAPPIQDRPL